MKLAGAAGVLGFALAAFGSAVLGAIDGGAIWQFPATDSSTAEVGAFIAAHRQSALAAMLLNTAGVTLWLVFGAGVWLFVRPSRTDGVLPTCFVVGMAAMVTLILAGFVPFFVLAYRAGHDVAHARLLYDATFGLLAISGAPAVLALGSYAAIVLRGDRLPRWTAWLALLGAGAHVVLLGSFLFTHGFVSLEGQVITVIPATLFVWILGTSIALLRAAEPA
jgi:hypothetical protein